MNVRKAVITAAGRDQRKLPLQVFVDRDGTVKSALQILIEEALSAGIEEICVVVCPGDQDACAEAAGDDAGRLIFVEQGTPGGYGHALCQAREFTGGEPFLHLVSDHLYISKEDKSCARQLMDIARAESCSVSAVQATRENMLPYYGTVSGRRLPMRKQVYEIDAVLEKPTPTEAEQRLVVPGMRAGYYLCLFGMHVLSASLMELLVEAIEETAEGETVQLSPSLNRLAARERYLALETGGVRYNIGVKYGLLIAQLALALEGRDRDEILTQLVELLAMRERTRE